MAVFGVAGLGRDVVLDSCSGSRLAPPWNLDEAPHHCSDLDVVGCGFPMKRLIGMSIMRGALLLASALLVFACGRKETMASKSAAAYRDAQAKGIPVTGGHEHGGHETATTTTGMEPMDHSAHSTGTDPHAGHNMTADGMADHTAHGAMSATDHATMSHGGAAGAHAGHTAAGGTATKHSAHRTMTAADHAAMGHGTANDAHAAMTGTAADQHAGMQHGTSTPAVNAHAGHGAMQQPAADASRVVLGAPTSNAAAAHMRPGATLQPDAFDTPAPSAVEEAQKAGGVRHEGHAPQPKPHAGHGNTSDMQ